MGNEKWKRTWETAGLLDIVEGLREGNAEHHVLSSPLHLNFFAALVSSSYPHLKPQLLNLDPQL